MPVAKYQADQLIPFWQTTDGETSRLYLGDVINVLSKLPSKSVHTVCTSPPYWGLRDYGTAQWEGGDQACNHKHEKTGTVQVLDRNGKPGSNNTSWQGAAKHATVKLGDYCAKCGAERVGDGQLGSEPSPDCGQLLLAGDGLYRRGNCGRCHVCKMVLVFREVKRVLRDDGTLWLNYGDSYSGGGKSVANPRERPELKSGDGKGVGCLSWSTRDTTVNSGSSGLPSGNLVGVPWRVALALQADGWVLRQDIVWSKPAPMPESVRNRCTKAHEYIFLLTKGMGYFCDMEAIKERQKVAYSSSDFLPDSDKDQAEGAGGAAAKASRANRSPDVIEGGMSNKRSVWTVSSQGYAGAHFATFPPRLIEPCILAGTSAHGCCGDCGAPWRRVVEERKLTRERPNEYVKRTGEDGTGNSCGNTVAGVEVKTTGWRPTCECHGKIVKARKIVAGYGSYHDHEEDGVAYGLRQNGKGPSSVVGEPTKEFERTVEEYVSDLPLEDHPVIPCTVLDPFVGSGTSVATANALGRRGWGIDLSEKYLKENAVPRVEGGLMSRPATVGLVPGREVRAVSLEGGRGRTGGLK